MITRRQLMRGVGTLATTTGTTGVYAFSIEPELRLATARYQILVPQWEKGQTLRIVALADIHASEPLMPASRVRAIVSAANHLTPDLVVLLGDFVTESTTPELMAPSTAWADALGGLTSSLGSFAVLGNHDWLDDREALACPGIPVRARVALERAGITVLENDAVKFDRGVGSFWLLGLADQIAYMAGGIEGRMGCDGPADLSATLRRITDDAPAILLAHEPDIFPQVPERVLLTMSGHTHGGQVRLGGWSPVVPSRYGNRYAYGHVREGGRNLIVSGGLGTSSIPVRFGVPPEIVVVELKGIANSATGVKQPKFANVSLSI